MAPNLSNVSVTLSAPIREGAYLLQWSDDGKRRGKRRSSAEIKRLVTEFQTSGLEGLYGMVKDRLGLEPLSGHLVFSCNGSRNRIKVLFWDGSGLWICAKRLEKGRFSWPVENEQAARVTLSHEELSLLLGGIDLTRTKAKDWYRKTITEPSQTVRCS